MQQKSSRIISTVLILLFLILTIIIVYSISTETQHALKGAVQDKLVAVASATASQIDGDSYARIREGEESTAEFTHIRDQLRSIKQATPDIRYVYTMRKNGDSVVFVVDGDYGYDSDSPGIGQAYPDAEPELFMGFITPTADQEFTTDTWGTVLSGFAPIRDRAGNVVGIVGIDMDSSVVSTELNRLNIILYVIGLLAMIFAVIGIIIFDHRRAIDEQKIEESEKKYRLLFERAGDAIFLLDADGEEQGAIIAANKAAADMHGFTIEELQRMKITDLDSPAERSRAPERFIQILDGVWLHGELTHLKKDGTEFPVEVSSGKFDLGTKRYILVIDRDISERKKTDDALHRVTAKLSLLNSVTFNDIQNAVFTLDGYNTLGKAFSDNEKVTDAFNKSKESIKKITRSLNFAKSYQDLGAQRPQWQDVNLVFIQGISHIDFSKIERNTHLDNLEIYADSLLERVFQMLAENVLRHAKTATRVTLGYEQDRESLILFFEDNGVGIPDTIKEKIFEREFGSHKGLELFLVRAILGITGITIRETGTPGSGARFEMVIPHGGYRFGQRN
ncbi:PAS domain S-box protein [Methanoregula sp.]|uniref:PAS domain S-box protein n=1 Tax=Methanoregula sp. TaxID=2052170 RepID=UPI003562BD29